MSNKNVEVFDMKDFLKKVDNLKFGYNDEGGAYVEATGCDNPEQTKLLQIWIGISVKWIIENLVDNGYAFLFDSIWDKASDDLFVSLSGGYLYYTDKEPPLELFKLRKDDVTEEAFNISLDFIDELMSYLEQPAHSFADPTVEIPSKFEVRSFDNE